MSAAAVDAEVPRGRTVGLFLLLGGLAVTVAPGSQQWVVLAGFSVAFALGVPLALADSPRRSRRALPIAVAVVAVASGWAAWARATSDLPERDRAHDGGVIVTRAAADEIRHLRNPYTTDFGPVLPSTWRLVEGFDGELVPNPVRHHFPYLPAAALVHVPFVAAAEAAGSQWDPRILGWMTLVGAVALIARRPETAWARTAAVLGLGSAFTLVYLSWGTNDTFAAALAVGALAVADKTPRWSGVMLAVAVSAKLLLGVLIPPLLVVIWTTGGYRSLRRWWTFPATLAATIVPFLVLDPAAFMDDTVWFNLGRSEPRMPTSGLGIPAFAPGFTGVPLFVVTLTGLVLALVLPVAVTRRRPSVWMAGATAGFALLAVLLPARTFQVNYLVLVAALVPLGFLSIGSTDTAGVESVPTSVEPSLESGP